MSTIFEQLNIAPDAKPDEIALQLFIDTDLGRVLLLSYAAVVVRLSLLEALLSAIEQRSYKAIWEKMCQSCKFRGNGYALAFCENINGLAQFETCPLCRSGEDIVDS